LFTIALVRSTSQLHEATKRIDEHSVVSERAYVTMSHCEPGLNFAGPSGPWVKMRVTNNGRTPAEVIDVILKLDVRDKGDTLPTLHDYQRPGQRTPAQGFLVAGDNFKRWESFPEITIDKSSADSGNRILWLYGYVEYVDVFGQRHQTGYIRRYHPHAPQVDKNNLVFDAQPGYSYHRLCNTGGGKRST